MPGATSPLGFPYPVAADPVDQLRVIFQQHAEAVDDYLAALAAVAAVAWTDLALNSGWTNVGASEKTQYARRAGMVTVALAALKGSIAAGESICTLPAGFRPSRPIRVTGSVNAAIRVFTINTSGTITSDVATTSGIVGHASFAV